jgi:AmmeMemoRadiSam system protein A
MAPLSSVERSVASPLASSAAADEADRALLERQGAQLLRLARDSIAYRLTEGRTREADASEFPEELRKPRAAFVTLSEAHQLRGCVGTPKAWRPLVIDVIANAAAAAFADPRFTPMMPAELPGVAIEISLLGPLEPIEARNAGELVAALDPGRHGLILCEGERQALFLPKVWELLPDPHAFLARLREKAGLRADYWSPRLELHRFTTLSIAERART